MRSIGSIIHKLASFAVYGHKCNGKLYLKHLRGKGIRIGDGTVLFNARTTTIDESDPQMVSIGTNVQITGGVTILSHDYGWAVTKAVYGDVLGSVRPVTIGNNVYIGMNAMILAGANIGNNVVIGANSVVTGSIPDNCVAVGSPCKKIYSLGDYHEKRMAAQLDEAVVIAKKYVECFGARPTVDIFPEHFWLWTNKKEDCTKHFIFQNNLIPGSEELTWSNFEKHEPVFNGFDEFLDYALDS